MRRPHELTRADFPVTKRALANTPSEVEGLIALCRAGKLYEVEEWIRSGKPLQWPQWQAQSYWRRNNPARETARCGETADARIIYTAIGQFPSALSAELGQMDAVRSPREMKKCP